MIDVETDTSALPARLASVDRERPVIDPARAEEGFARHLRALRLPARSIDWAPDAETAYLDVEDATQDPAWVTAASRAAVEVDRLDKSMTWNAARNAVWPICWTPAESRLRTLFRASSETDRRAKLERGARVFRTAASAVADAATWLAATANASTPRIRRACERCADIWAPFIDLYEAGLWLFRVCPKRIVAVPRPAITTDAAGRLHRDDGPAARWNRGRSYYFWHGVRVDEQVVLRPDTITVQDIVAEQNTEVRRVMIERLGYERLVLERSLAPLHVDEFGALYRLRIPREAPLAFVRVRNSTPEPDGAWKWFFLRVPPDMRTAREAVAWTFGMRADEYAPTRET